jgi:hypothetical protein
MNIKEPNRTKRSYVQHLEASPEAVFPLLCPVLEAEWAPGWMPELVLSRSGVCEQDCTFITSAEPPSERHPSIWIVSKYDPASWTLQMYKVTPEHTISKLGISLEEKSGTTTSAAISYEITAIGAAGHEFMKEFTDESFNKFMAQWEMALNHYLKTGKMIAIK